MSEEPATLPNGWEWATLGDLGDWIGGGTPSKSNPSYWSGGTIPWVSPKDMKASVIADAADRITETAVTESSTQMVPAGSVLVVTRSGILQRTVPVAITAISVAINQDLKAIVPRSGVVPAYVAAYIRARERDVLDRCSKDGTTVASIGLDALRSYPIPLPPEAEQQRIVAKLNELLASSSAARDALEAVPMLLERFRQSVLAAAFRGELTADWRARHGQSHEMRWQRVSLGEVATEVRNGVSATPGFEPPGTPILRISAVRNGNVALDDLRYLADGEDLLKTYALRDGDLLFTRYNGNPDLVGACGMVRGVSGEVMYPDKLIRVRCNKGVVLPEYIELFFASAAARAALVPSVKSTSGQHGISGTDLKAQMLPLPSIGEQRQIAMQVRRSLDSMAIISEGVAGAQNRIDEVQRAVLGKAFRGELVPQDPNDEPASVLLERIRAERAATEKPARKPTRRTSARA